MTDPKTPHDQQQEAIDDLLDEELDETFPASDPPSSLLREGDKSPKPA
ncbi:MAG: hypothetical protein V4466_11830 [Pseudomonadota bacterium]